MKKHLFLHLSFMGLMGLSTIAYGGWTKYGSEFKSGDPIPNGDCLEMMCQYGCVEDESFNGTCCPNDGTNGSTCTIEACCQSGVCINGKCGCEKDTDCAGEQVCLSDKTCGCLEGEYIEGKCRDSSCNFNGVFYPDKSTIGDCGKCQNGIIITDKEEDCKTCNTTTWNWDLITDYTSKDSDGKCCIDGSLVHDSTLCPDPGQCHDGASLYANGQYIGSCGQCVNGVIDWRNRNYTIECGDRCCQSNETCVCGWMCTTGKHCLSNNDCGSSEFCAPYCLTEDCITAPVKDGVCESKDGGIFVVLNNKKYLLSTGIMMTFPQAKNWCKAHKKQLVSYSDLESILYAVNQTLTPPGNGINHGHWGIWSDTRANGTCQAYTIAGKGWSYITQAGPYAVNYALCK